VVFGDIGTSPLYAMRETFAGGSPAGDRPDSRLRRRLADLLVDDAGGQHQIHHHPHPGRQQGRGGSLALLALISRKAKIRNSTGIVLLGVFACALFYGDSMITPAISVLSAVEGLTVVQSRIWRRR
jgi:KUP system potassium uptake protein